MRTTARGWTGIALSLALAGCGDVADPAGTWERLFDGKALGHWKSTPFGGEGEVRAEEGRIVLEMGSNMTGVTWQGPALPAMDYEVRLEAARLDGSDFFCALTFPVGEHPISFVVGGWGGGTVGLSSLDGMDASENDTSQFMSFEKGRWYRIRARVTKSKIETWIDDKRVADVETRGRRISIRPECDLSRPLGVASYSTKAALRNIEIRRLP